MATMLKLIKFKWLMLLALFAGAANASLEIVITDGVDSARPIAVVPFKFEGATQPSENISQIDIFRRLGSS